MTLSGNLDDVVSSVRHVCASWGLLGRSMVPKVIVFHDDIDEFVVVFGRFPANEPISSLTLFETK